MHTHGPWSMVHVPKVGVTNRRGKHKYRIYSHQDQCPASRGIGMTVILRLRHYMWLTVAAKTRIRWVFFFFCVCGKNDDDKWTKLTTHTWGNLCEDNTAC